MRIIFISILLAMSQLPIVGSEIWKSPHVLFNISSRLSVKQAEFNQQETKVTFEYVASPFSRFRLPSRIVAVDQEGRRYPAVSTQGIALDSTQLLSENGKIIFSISFAPMQGSCESFDILSDNHREGIRIYGISKKRKRAANSKVTHLSDCQSLNDTIVIQGHIADMDQIDGKSRQVSFAPLVDARTGLSTASITDKGVFMFSFVSTHPIWGNFIIDHQFFQFLGTPGDTLSIEIDKWRQWNEDIAYRSRAGNDCYEKLLLHGDYIEGSQSLDQLAWPDFKKAVNRLLQDGLSLVNYISIQYGLSGRESHLLSNQMKFQYIYRMLFYLLRVSDMHDIYPQMPSMIRDEDYEFLKVADWNDCCLQCTRGWTQSFRQMLLRVLLHDSDDYKDFKEAYQKRLRRFMPHLNEKLYPDFEPLFDEIMLFKNASRE